MPLMIWATHVLQWRKQREAKARAGANLKRAISSDGRLQLACTKLESLVIVNQHVAVNTFPGLDTARHTMEVSSAEVSDLTEREGAAEGGTDNWGEVVQGSH